MRVTVGGETPGACGGVAGMATAASDDETGATAGGGAGVRVAEVEVTEGARLAAVELAACGEVFLEDGSEGGLKAGHGIN